MYVRKLQESLSDQNAGAERKEEGLSKIDLVEDQHAIEKEDRSKQIQKELEGAAPAKPKLFKTPADEQKPLSNKEYKKETGISRARMANIQRRIKPRVESRRSMPMKRRVPIISCYWVIHYPSVLLNYFSVRHLSI